MNLIDVIVRAFWHKNKGDASNCFGLSAEDQVVSFNPCLRAPHSYDPTEAIIQAAPEGWDVHNVLENADGYEDEWSEKARITFSGSGLTFMIHRGGESIDGQWGYAQQVTLTTGCHLLKVSGRGLINDPPHVSNYSIKGYLDGMEIGSSHISLHDGFEIIFPFSVAVQGVYQIKWMLCLDWATAGEGSFVDIHSAAVLSVEDGYCE